MGGEAVRGLVRYHADSTRDTNFSSALIGSAEALIVQDDGKIVVAGGGSLPGEEAHARVVRLNVDGSLDPTLNYVADISVWCLALQLDGKILVGGDFTSLGGQPRDRLARINVDGSLDEGFRPSVSGAQIGAFPTVAALAVQPDGKILVGGTFTHLNAEEANGIGRLNSNGSLDESFTTQADRLVFALAPHADGKILVGGHFAFLGGQSRSNLARLNTDGSIDLTFNPGANDYVLSFAVQTDGTILVGGRFTTLGEQPRTYIGRLNAVGSVDATFNPGANLNAVEGLAVQLDGKILVGGEFTMLAGEPRSHVGRLTSSSAALQSITIDPGGTSATWSRSGSGPEVERVTFEQSTDGSNYVLLGQATRINGGWQLSGMSLPRGELFYLRARGRTSGGIHNASSGLIESVAQFYQPVPPSPPQLAVPEVLDEGEVRFFLTNSSRQSFTLIATTNLALPFVQWEVLGPLTSVGGGVYQFFDHDAANYPQRFYQLRWP